MATAVHNQSQTWSCCQYAAFQDLQPGLDLELRNTVTGMLQFPLRCNAAPQICGNHRIYPGRAVRHLTDSQRYREDALFCSEGGRHLVDRGYVHDDIALFRCILTFSIGSIPEREESSGNLYNTCTVYSPKGSSYFHLPLTPR